MRKYDDRANWEFGWGVLSCDFIDGEDEEGPTVRKGVSVVPLLDLLTYLADPALVLARLNAAAARLVDEWNALPQGEKHSIEWADEVSRCCWQGKNNKREESLFHVRLNTWAFTGANKDDKSATITKADLKCTLKLQTTVDGGIKKPSGPNKRSQNKFHFDYFGINVRLSLFLGLLRSPELLTAVAAAAESVRVAADFRLARDRAEAAAQDGLHRQLLHDAASKGVPRATGYRARYPTPKRARLERVLDPVGAASESFHASDESAAAQGDSVTTPPWADAGDNGAADAS